MAAQMRPGGLVDGQTPAYRHKKNRNTAIVTLTDSVTKERRDYQLGDYDTPQSRERYHCLIAQWEAADRRLPARKRQAGEGGATINEVIAAYMPVAAQKFSPTRMFAIKDSLRILRELYGSSVAEDFGPMSLVTVRNAMANRVHPKGRWSRKYVNTQALVICKMFKWAVARELVPVSVHQALLTVEPLKRGQTTAPETKPVTPANDELIEAAMPYMSRQVRAIVELQLLTGARPGELLGSRSADIDTTGTVWTCTLVDHKTAHRGRDRVLYFGPQAQRVLEAFMGSRPANAFLFSPADAESERHITLHASRKTPLSCGNRPGTNVKDNPKKHPGDRYTSASYRRAITYACDRAFVPPPELAALEGETTRQWRARLTPKQRAQLDELRKENQFTPYQLRHTAATRIRKAYGLEAAQLVLGHSSALVTDAVYAERDAGRVIQVIGEAG